MKSLIFPTALIFSVIVISRAQQEICDDGWLRFEDSIGNGVCVLMRQEPAEWEVAMKYCEERLGNLLDLDRFGELNYNKPGEQRAIFIGEELVQAYSIEEFWSGMKVDRGRLMWDDYGPQLVTKSKSDRTFWSWGDSQPDPMAGKCGKATVFKSQQNGIPSYDYKRVSVNLTPCTTKLPFVCRKTLTKQVVKTGSGFIKTESDYFDQKKLLDYQAFEPLPVYGVLDRHLQENEIIFVRTPSFILNSSNSYFQWNYDNTVLWRVQESSNVSARYYVNITLPFDQNQPQRRRRGIDDAYASRFEIQKRKIGDFDEHFDTNFFTSVESTTPSATIPDIGDEIPPQNEGEDVRRFFNIFNIRDTTGYYTFGIYNTNPPRYLERKPQLVCYSEKYLYIYVVYCEFLDYVIGPSKRSFISMEDVNSFNLLQDDSYINTDKFREIGLSRVLSEPPTALGDYHDRYSAKIESFENTTVKFRVFVAPIRTETTEQIVYKAVQEHFKMYLPNGTFKLNTLKVRSTVMCPFNKIVKDGNTLTFNPIRIGQTAFSWERCYPDNKALATSLCRGGYDDGAALGQITLADNCGSVPVFNEAESTVLLKNLSKTEITNENSLTVLKATVNLTRPDLNLSEYDIIHTADILYNYLLRDIVITAEVMEIIFKVVDNVLRTGSDVIDTAQKITNAANRIILSVDELTNKISLLNNKYVRFSEDLIASDVWDQTGGDNVTIGINLEETSSTEIQKEALSSMRGQGDVKVNETDTAIYLTETLLKGDTTQLTFLIYGNTGLFSDISSRFKVNSKVAAARLNKNNNAFVDLGDEYVTAIFYPYEDSKNLVCAYWNYTANEDAGGWDTDGCTLFSYESGRVVCKCNHLTNFAVLIDLEAGTISETDKLVLGIITKVGLFISIAGLGITILTFLIFKHIRSGRGQQVLVNLSVAMLCSYILFLIGVDRTESYGGCIAVSVLLHYFILVTFMWMLVEGVLQYLRFVKVIGTYIPKFMIKSMIPAWGIPLIPVIIVLVIDYDMYYGGKGYCWLSWKPFLYAFVIPIAVIILANIVVFFMVMSNLCCRRKHKGMVSNQSERKMAFLHFQAGISILVILGLTWVFGFLTIDDTRIVFHYLFAIFNAFQGFFIFLLFTAREKQIRKAWRKLCCKESPYKSTTSGSGTDSDSRPKKQSADNT